jgi:hypothetical protein
MKILQVQCRMELPVPGGLVGVFAALLCGEKLASQGLVVHRNVRTGRLWQ